MKVESKQLIHCEEVIMDGADTWHLRMIGPPDAGEAAGKPIWYEFSEVGWRAIGNNHFTEHEEAYQRSLS